MIVTPQTLDSVIQKLLAESALGLDTETTGLLYDDRPFAIIISTEEETFYFNFNSFGGSDDSVLDRDLLFAGLALVFADPGREYFIHNAKFDLRMLLGIGLRIRGHVICSYAVARVLRNDHMAYSLDATAKRAGLAVQKSTAVKEYITKNRLVTKISMPGKKSIYEKHHYDRVPFEIMAPYAEIDARLHYDLAQTQKSQFLHMEEEARELEIPSLQHVLANEIRLTQTLLKMEERGILIDRPFVSRALEYELEEVRKAEERFCLEAGEPYLDSRVVFKRVFDRLGCSYPTTEKGNPSFSADVLEEMENPAADLINKIRYHQKRAGTYYSSFLFFADKNDVIHADAQQAGTTTGRMSYRDPNLQNVPKEDDPEDLAVPYHVRESFIPRPGHYFVAIDYKQMEYRQMMDYAGETRVIQDIMAGVDFHDAIAAQVGVTRKQAKTLNFALSYGAGDKKIAKMLSISQVDARDLRLTYFGKLPRLEKFFKRVQESGKARGFIFNWLGRRCYLNDPKFSYALPNHLIQGGCQDVMKVAMNRIDDLLATYKSKMLLQVHDELLFELVPGEEALVPRIQEIMENVYPGRNGIKLEVSVEHSLTNWGVRSKVKGMP